jgi:hypothetical protein
MKTKLILLLVLILSITTSKANPKCFYASSSSSANAPAVNTTASSPSNDIQGIFNAAIAGDTVKFTKGTYVTPATNYYKIDGKGTPGVASYLILQGGWNSNFTVHGNKADSVVITRPVTNSVSLLYIHTSNVVIDGITFRDGYSTGQAGGAINNDVANGDYTMIVKNCIFKHNQTTNNGGGAVFEYSANYNTNTGHHYYYNCIFNNNIAPKGGGVYTAGPTVRFYNCTFTNNSGSAIFHEKNGYDVIISCTIAGNTNSSGDAAVNSNNAAIYNNIIAGNVLATNNGIAADIVGGSTDWGYNILGYTGASTNLLSTSHFVSIGALNLLLENTGTSGTAKFLGKLADNGGNTPTLKLIAKSVIATNGTTYNIDITPSTIPTPGTGSLTAADTVPTIDQRGIKRATGYSCVGAYEFRDAEFVTPPTIKAQWAQTDGIVNMNIDIYKYKSDTRFYHDMYLPQMEVWYSTDSTNFTKLFYIASSYNNLSKQVGLRSNQYRGYAFNPASTGTYFEIRNRTTATEAWKTVSNTTTVAYANEYSSDSTYTASVHWHIPTSLVGKKIYLKYINSNGFPVKYDQDLKSISGNPTGIAKQLTILKNLSGIVTTPPSIVTSAAWQPNGSLKYAIKPIGIPNNVSYTTTNLENSTIVKTSTYPDTIQTFNYTISELSQAKIYKTLTIYSPNTSFTGYPTYTISDTTIVKALAMPANIVVTANTCIPQNVVTFSVDALIDKKNYETANFELERDTVSSFTSSSKRIITTSVAYDPNKTDNYSITDNTLLYANSTKTYYYRLRRTPLISSWGWSIHVCDGNVAYDSKAKTITDFNVIIDPTTKRPKMTWTYSAGGSFCAGNSVIISLSSNGGSPTDIKTYSDINTTSFIDNSTLTSCVPLIYKIRIGTSTNFTSLSDDPVTYSDMPTPQISYMKASKGYYNDRVEVEWNLTQGSVNSFLVQRKLYEETSDKYVTIAEINATSSSLYKYLDMQAVPSTYYTYQIKAVTTCNSAPAYTTLSTSTGVFSDIGFRVPTAVVGGRIVYTGDVPVAEANIVVQGADKMKNKAIKVGGTDSNILILPYTLIDPNAFTIQGWFRIQGNSLLLGNGWNVYIYKYGQDIQLKCNFRTKNIKFNKDNDPSTSIDNQYFHLTLVKEKNLNQITVYKNGVYLDTLNYSGTMQQATSGIKIGAYGGAVAFVDELRFWNRNLLSTEVKANYDRYITGKEDGLVGYYRFDEPINESFFDMSSKNGIFNENHGIINGTCPRTDTIPNSEQLSLKGKTDNDGNYIIGGIPYFADGTSYTFTPQLGTHQFNPTQKPLFLSDKSAIQNNIDFTDVSSFAYNGYVIYDAGKNIGNYPVEGVSFLIDDKTVVNSKGQQVLTDNTGYYQLQVPIGQHTIKAQKYGHTFSVNHGSVSNDFEEDQRSAPNLIDSTYIKLIGRVVGGNRESGKPLLVGQSINNIGNTTLILKPAKSALYSMTNADRNFDVSHDDINLLKKHITKRNTYSIVSDNITINTCDSTGEFVAYVYPEDYTITSITAGTQNGGSDLRGSNVNSVISLKNQVNKQYVTHTWTDSILVPAKHNQNAYYQSVNHIDSVMYNALYNFTYYTTPNFSITELNQVKIPSKVNGDSLIYQDKKYFGDSLFVYKNPDTNISDTINLAIVTNNVPSYTFDQPLYQQGNHYYFKFNAFEKYQNTDLNLVDLVPLKDASITVDNTMKVGNQTTPESIVLDTLGNAMYSFTGGLPDLTTGMKKFAATLNKNNISYNWENNLTPYYLGSEGTGTNFTTAGPDQVLFVLRDPPGSLSYSYLEQGSTFSSSDTKSVKEMFDTSLKTISKFGPKIVTWVGLGAGIVTELETTADMTVGLHINQNYSHTWGSTSSFTTTKRYETSSDPLWVGAAADLFVGLSTNYLYGLTKSLTISKTASLSSSDTKITDNTDKTWSIVSGKGMFLGQKFATEFAYTARDLEQIFIPKWTTLRNQFLKPYANRNTLDSINITKPQYYSKLSVIDPNFGRSNTDSIFGNNRSERAGDGPSYYILIPYHKDNSGILKRDTTFVTDSVMWCNNQINTWRATLKHNEELKYNATKIDNESFTSGAKFEYSESTSKASSNTNSFDLMLSGIFGIDSGVEISGVGVDISFQAELGLGSDGSFTTETTNNKTVGFVLQETGDYDTHTVDYKNTDDGTISFDQRGGQTSCPYEGAVLSKYFKPGTILSQATMQIENPKISVVNSSVNNIPSNRDAVYELELKNESDVDADGWYNLIVDGTTNKHGAQLKIDGAIIDSKARPYLVKANQVLHKTLTLTKGPNEYNDTIRLILASQCQYDPTDFTADIADSVLISASFVPICSDISLTAPSNNWVVNTTTGDSIAVKLENFDVNTTNFGYISLQTKASSSSIWTEQMKYYANNNLFNAANGAKTLIDPSWKNIQFELNLHDYPDNNYDIQAVSYCIDPASKAVIAQTPTTIASGIKDMVRPILFGSTQPTDGILNSGDQIQVQFNEDIAEGLVTHNNISVTGIKNGSNNIHTATVHFDGVASSMSVQTNINLDKSFTFECWLKRNQLGQGTILSHGGSGGFEFGFNSINQLYVKNGSANIVSTSTFSDLLWNHYSVIYDADRKVITVYVNGGFVGISDAPFVYSSTGALLIGVNASNINFLAADMNELRLWETALDQGTIAANMYTSYNGIELYLIGYWQMNEGKGKIAYDISRGRNAALNADWTLNPSGKSIALSGTSSSVTLKTSKLPISASSDYSFELWFNADKTQADSAYLFSAGRGDGKEYNNSRNNAALWFNKQGQLAFANNGRTILLSSTNYIDNQWHHVAVSVNRLSSLNFYIDGVLVNNTDSRGLTTINAQEMYLGMRKYMLKDSYNTYVSDKYFTGLIDEFRIWNISLSESMINRNINTRLQGNEVGLAAYYPFDAYINNILSFSLNNQVVASKDTAVLSGASFSNVYAPIKIGKASENLGYDFVTNKDKININLTEQNSAIERTTVNVTVSDIQDKNGNKLASPISWDVYIDQSQLKWDNNSMTVNKAINTDLSFTSKITNSGATDQKFQITNAPTWLSVTPSYGSIKPNSSQDITFVVDKGLNIGAYDENLYLRSAYNEPLSLRLNVMSEIPNWTVDPSKYNKSMNIIASLSINDIISTDINDKVGVFMDGECCGVGQPVYYKSLDKYLLYLKVFAIDSLIHNSRLTFKVFDASSGQIFSGRTIDPINFENDALKGLPSQPVLISAKNEIYQTIPLNNGWTWISIQVANPDLSVQTTLNGMKANSGDLIKDNSKSLFDSYSANSQSWNGTLTLYGGLNNLSMYLIKSSMLQTLSIAGTVIDPTMLSIGVKGQKWNYLSYLPTRNIAPTEAFAGYGASANDILKSQNAFSVYDPTVGWIGDLTYLEPGKGYMLYRTTNTDTQFTYPANTSNGSRIIRQNAITVQPSRVEPGKYPETMNMIANLAYKDGLNANDWILGYSGSELVSANQLGEINSFEKPIIFVNLSAEKESVIHFELERDAKVIAKSDQLIQFEADMVVGNLKSPYSLSFNTNTGDVTKTNSIYSKDISITTYPNPVDNELRVQIIASKTQNVNIMVTDLIDKVMIETGNLHSINNYFEKTFNMDLFQPGIYIIKINIADQLFVKKIIKK